MRNNSLIVKNSFFLAIRTIVITLVSLYSVRELLLLLGIDGYGLFNLIFGVAALFSFINSAMVSSTQRYLAYYIGKEDEILINRVWSNSIVLHFGIGLITSIFLFSIKNILLKNILQIDYKFMQTAYFIYYCSILVIFISVMQAPLNALIVAKEKISFFAFLSLLDAILKLFIIYILYFFEKNILEKYTILYLFSIITIFIIYYYFCVKKLKKGFQYKSFNLDLLKEILIYSLWNIFGNFAYIAKIQGINVLLNMFIGVVANSAYAITTSISSAISNLANSVVTAINPQIYKSYAEQDLDRNTLLINTASKFSFFFCLIVIFPILFNTKYFLELWLNQLPLYLINFVKLALIVLLIECLSGSLMTGIQATGKVKKYQIVVSISVILNLPISYIALKIWQDPLIIYWVAIFMSLVSFILRLYFINSLINFNIVVYLNDVILKVVLVVLSSTLLATLVLNIIDTQYTFLSFVNVSLLIVVSVLFSIITFGLKTLERQFVFSKIKGYLK